MTNTAKINALKELAPLLVARGVTGLSVFGSRVRGDAHAKSDIDLIVDYDPASHFSLLDLAAVARLVEEHIGIKPDVMTRCGLHSVLKNEIEAEAVRVF